MIGAGEIIGRGGILPSQEIQESEIEGGLAGIRSKGCGLFVGRSREFILPAETIEVTTRQIGCGKVRLHADRRVKVCQACIPLALSEIGGSAIAENCRI